MQEYPAKNHICGHEEHVQSNASCSEARVGFASGSEKESALSSAGITNFDRVYLRHVRLDSLIQASTDECPRRRSVLDGAK